MATQKQPESDTRPRQGRRFAHATQIRRDSSPKAPGGAASEICTITAVRNDMVYYRNSTGFLSKIEFARFSSIVQHWIDTTSENDT